MVANVLKMKAAALLLGPTGVGLIGLYSSLFQTTATVAALGLDSAGTRELATARSTGSELAVGRTRRTIFWCGLILALIGGAVFFASSNLIARVVLDDHSRQSDVAWLSIGVALTVITASQTAIITGLHRVGDLARINIGASVLGTAISVLALWLWREQALLVIVLIAPLFTAIFTYVFMKRLGRPPGHPLGPREMVSEAVPILRLGIYAMLGVVFLQLGFLVVRANVQHQLGSVALGQFQAAWAIGVAYQALVIASMASDYFPRLTAAIKNRHEAAKLINEQTEVGLLLCSPFILALLGFAPWVIHVFYSSEFTPAADVLRWQLMGDLIKMVYYPIGYALFAMGSARLFSFNQLLAVAALVAGALALVPHFGLSATGVAYLLMYLVFVPIPWWAVRRRINFRWSRAVRWQATAAFTAAMAVVLANRHSATLGAVCGGTLATSSALWAVIRISQVAGAGGRLGLLTRLGTKIRLRARNNGD